MTGPRPARSGTRPRQGGCGSHRDTGPPPGLPVGSYANSGTLSCTPGWAPLPSPGGRAPASAHPQPTPPVKSHFPQRALSPLLISGLPPLYLAHMGLSCWRTVGCSANVCRMIALLTHPQRQAAQRHGEPRSWPPPHPTPASCCGAASPRSRGVTSVSGPSCSRTDTVSQSICRALALLLACLPWKAG